MKRVKKLITAVLVLMLISLPNLWGLSNCFTYEAKAATFDEINNPEVFLKQVNGDMQCTLVAATMLIRRAAMLSGNTSWADITVDKVKEQAWIAGTGLRYTFTYAGITVNKTAFKSDPVNEAISLLKLHPEGIVIYDQNRSPRSHAVLLTDYTSEIFYSADPAEAAPSGRIPNSSALVQVKDAESYWYVSSPSVSLSSPSVTEGNAVLPTADISTYAAQLSQTSYSYDGTQKKPVVSIPGLIENVDYRVTYINNVNPGSASVIISGIGTYSGMVTKSFEITDTSVLDKIYEIKIIMTKQTIKKGKTAAIKVTLPASLELVKDYSGNLQTIYNEVKIGYASDNKKIATVNTNGKITGKTNGTANIFVNVEGADGTKKTFPLKIKVK